MPLFSSGRGKSSYSRPPKEEFQFKLNTVMSHRRRSAPSQANCNGARQKHSSDQGQVIAYEPAKHYTVLSPNEMAWLSNKVGIIHSTSRCFAINGQMARFDENTVALTKCLAFTFAPGDGYLLKARRSAGRWWSSDKADWKSVVVTWSGRRLYPLHSMKRLLLKRSIIPRTNIALSLRTLHRSSLWEISKRWCKPFSMPQ
jgi:hypothetical protein